MPRHRFFTLSPDILCSIGFDGFFKRVNPAFTSTLGHSEKQLRRIPYLDFVHPEDRESTQRELEKLQQEGDVGHFENRCRCTDGAYKWLSWNVCAYPNDKVIYAAARDTTRQREDEDKLRSYNRQLQQLSEVAQAATRAKSEFLANISHELRTPMTAILGLADVLSTDVDESSQLDAVRTIRRNGEYLLTLINDILDLSKIEAGKLNVELIRCSPWRVLRDVASLMGIRAKHKGLRLVLETETPLPESIETDPIRFRQILINLIDNAIKFTNEGQIRIRVCLEEPARSAACLSVQVRDSGIGMSPTQVDRLFRPFTQADNSTTRRFGGTGLGLTISKRLATMLGGDITVESRLDYGSTFTLRIRTGELSGVPRLAEPPPEASLLPESGDRVALTIPGRVLLVEDYPDIQLPVSYSLRRAGLEVDVAENGQEAIDRALQAEADGDPFHVVLMDMQMPVVDGYTATSILRDSGYQGPIVAMTAHAMECDRQKCISCGCDDYITKPLDMNHLLRLLDRHVSRANGARSLVSPRT